MKRILSKKMPVAYVIGLFALVVFITIGVTKWLGAQSANNTAQTTTNCAIKVQRLGGYSLIKPIMFADEECPSTQLEDIKQSLVNTIQSYTQYQNVNKASVYLRDLDTNKWTVINETEQYEPGSLFKVPLLIAALKMNEAKPGTLNKRIAFNTNFDITKKAAYQSKSIQLGQQYSLRELLTYMIVYSDNNATALVQNNIDLTILTQLFTDVGLAAPDYKAAQYYFTAQNYSLFMRAIYNASYLNKENSLLAAQLLSQSTFRDGILKGLPNGTSVAHKFGESGNLSEVQLHESAIVYLNNKTYLLTIMTKGKDVKTLSNLMAELSKAIYDNRLASIKATL
jgi:beta-lactamase class A